MKVPEENVEATPTLVFVVGFELSSVHLESIRDIPESHVSPEVQVANEAVSIVQLPNLIKLTFSGIIEEAEPDEPAIEYAPAALLDVVLTVPSRS